MIDGHHRHRHSGPMHPPANPWQPPPRNDTPLIWIAAVTGVVVVLCCGGFIVANAISGPPDQAPNQSVTVTDPVGQPEPNSAPPAADSSPSPSRTVTSESATAAPKTTEPEPAPTRTTRKPTTKKPKPKPKPTTEEPEEVYYKNCSAVRAAGADPIYRGDPGYARHLDRDGDGVGCE